MKLERVTITGADETVRPSDLAALSAEFPFAEWGILFSPKRQGSSRFPGRAWVNEVAGLDLPLSAHLCGAYVRNLLAGGSDWFADNYLTIAAFFRLQINAGAGYAGRAEPAFLDTLRKHGTRAHEYPRQYIFQSAGDFAGLIDKVYSDGHGIDAVPLFDRSGGDGIVPESWPRAEYMDVVPDDAGEPVEVPVYHGYAGGLGPETLTEQLPRIAEAAGSARIWIDMESGVRSDQGRRFDLVKVRQCLELTKAYVET